MKNTLRQLLPLLGYLFVTAVLYPDVWLGRSDLYFNDLIDLNVPQRQIAAEIWRSGEVPLWNRYAFGGQPLLAAGQAGILYPPNVLFLFLPAQTAMNVSTVLHLVLAGLLMSLFLRQLWERAFPAWVGGAIYMTSGFLAGHVMHTQMLNAAAWIPLVLYFLERLRQQQRVRDVLGLALTLALLILAGHPQIVYYTGLLCLAYLVFLLAGESRNRRRILLAVGAGGVLAGLLAAAQLWPTYGLLQRSFRHQITYDFFTDHSLPLRWLGALLVPFRNGGGGTGHPGDAFAWELTGYAGVAALLLAVMAVCRPRERDRHRLLFAAIGLAGLILAAGDVTYANPLLYRLPVANQFRVPARFVLFFDLAVAVLAARALCGMMEREGQSRSRGEELQRTHGGRAAWVIGGAFLLFIVGDPLWSRDGLPIRVWLVPGLCVLATLGLLYALRARPQVLAASLGVLIVLDNSSHVREFTHRMTCPMEVSRCGRIPGATGTGEWIRLLQADAERGRIASFDATLAGNRPGQCGLEAINGYDALYPRVYAQAVNLQTDSGGLALPDSWRPLIRSREAIDLLNVRYVVARHEAGLGDTPPARPSVQIPIPGNPLVEAVKLRYRILGRHPIYQITGQGPVQAPLARVTFVGRDGSRESHLLAEEIHLKEARCLQRIDIDYTEWRGNLQISRLQFFGAEGRLIGARGPLPMLGHAFEEIYRDPARAVFRNGAAFPRYWMTGNPEEPRTQLAGPEIRETAYRHREFSVRVDTPSPGWLVVGQLHDPGWVADVDGKRECVREIGEHLMGIHLAAGDHEVRFRYEPVEWVYGVRVTLLALLAAATLAWGACRRGVW